MNGIGKFESAREAQRPQGGLDGPCRRIKVEPLKRPAIPPRPAKPRPKEDPTRRPVRITT
jgi:hypothetical protein